ncbi:5'-adenylylsulfate reductase-like 4 [Lycium ferocissimum]|uniref:5'-adenylylsulfate reductase-like 4 n=1 Tax=Lycium ferocissimum TaxID=112874 RepID=UPI0028159980|nr:5'-adenylylsulfate reductase-like 4 [Lycium ferocissimum]
MIHRNTHNYVALLFYASWCPFSKSFWPNFSIMSSLFPSIPNFAIEEFKPRLVMSFQHSKYGVHGFPTLILLNPTIRMQYHGSCILDSD